MIPFIDNTKLANTIRWSDVGWMLGQRRRRWASINPTLGQHLVFAGISTGEVDIHLVIQLTHHVVITLVRCSPTSITLAQHWASGACGSCLGHITKQSSLYDTNGDLQSQNAVTAYLKSMQLLPFGSAQMNSGAQSWLWMIYGWTKRQVLLPHGCVKKTRTVLCCQITRTRVRKNPWCQHTVVVTLLDPAKLHLSDFLWNYRMMYLSWQMFV